MKIDWNIVIAIATSLGVIVALLANLRQSKILSLSLGIDTLLRLEHDYYYTDEFYELRSKAAKSLIAGQSGRELKELLSHLDTIGLLTKNKVIPIKFIWNEFAYHVFGYYHNVRTKLSNGEDLLKTEWNCLVELENILYKYSQSNVGSKRHDPRKMNFEEFIQSEAKLLDKESALKRSEAFSTRRT